MRNALFVGAVAVVLLVSGGCTSNEKAEVREDVRGVREQIRNAADNAQQAATNAALAGKVKAALSTRKGLAASDIHVEARGDKVTLKGDVKSREQADLADRVALETRGVREVDNQLMIRIPAKDTAPSTPSAGAY